MKTFVAILLTWLAAVGATPAIACSVSPGPEVVVERIKAGSQYRLVKGRFIVTETEFLGGGKAIIRGRIETARGTGWDVWVDYDQFFIDCVYFFAPVIDAEGTFWISRKKLNGRYEVSLWEGYYTPEALEEQRRAEETETAKE